MRQFPVEECSQANQEHRDSQRQYAHVFHRDGVICVAHAFWQLPERLRLALLLHEVGHLLAGPRGGELAANRAAERYSGIPIEYQDCRYGEELESISERFVPKAKEVLGLNGTVENPVNHYERGYSKGLSLGRSVRYYSDEVLDNLAHKHAVHADDYEAAFAEFKRGLRHGIEEQETRRRAGVPMFFRNTKKKEAVNGRT